MCREEKRTCGCDRISEKQKGTGTIYIIFEQPNTEMRRLPTKGIDGGPVVMSKLDKIRM